MTDLIERGEKLIRLTEVKAILVVNHCDQENLDRLLKRIEALPPATPWRPASEVPQGFKNVAIGKNPGGEDALTVVEGWYDSDASIWYDFEGDPVEAICWTELPTTGGVG